MDNNVNLLIKSSNQFLDFLANLFIVCVKITVEIDTQVKIEVEGQENVFLEQQNLKQSPAELDDQFLDTLFELYWELFVMAPQAQDEYEYLQNLEIVLQRLQAFTSTNWITLSTMFIGPLLVLALAYYNKNINLLTQRIKSIVLTKPDATFSQNRGGSLFLRIRQFNPFRLRRGGAATYIANRWRSFRYRVPLLSNDYEDLNAEDRATRISNQTLIAQNINSEVSQLIIRDFEIKLNNQTYMLDPPAFEMDNHTRRSISYGLNQNPLCCDESESSSNSNMTQFLSNVANYDFELAQKLIELQKGSNDIGSRLIALRNARRDTAIFISKAQILSAPLLTEAKFLLLNDLLEVLMINLGFSKNEASKLVKKFSNINQFVQNNNIDGLLNYILTEEMNPRYFWVSTPKLFLIKRCENFFRYQLPFLNKLYEKYSLFITLWTMTFAVDTYVIEKLIGKKIKEIQSEYNNQLSPKSLVNKDYLRIGSSIFFTEALNTINSREKHFNPVYWYETISVLSQVDKKNILENLNCVIARLFEQNQNILRENPQLIWLYKIIYEDIVVSRLIQESQEELFQEEPFQEGVQESKED